MQLKLRIMFVQFKVGNFLSFKNPVTFSMVGYPPIKEHEFDKNFCNVFDDPSAKIKLLKSAVIYGANGSGKSNLLAAMGFFKSFILSSSNNSQATDEINVKRFLFSSETEDEPSYFEMIFFIGDTRYRFGFEADRQKIYSEWLFSLKNESSSKETKLFTREFQAISSNKIFFKEGIGLENRTRDNALFLSTVAQLNGEIATKILTWIKPNFNLLNLDQNPLSYTVNKFQKEEKFKQFVVEFFKSIQIGFENVEIVEEIRGIEKSLRNNIPDQLKEEVESVISALQNLQNKAKNSDDIKVESKGISINTLHKKFDISGQFQKYESLDFGLESKGTQKLFALLGPIYDTIQNNRVLIIDELDSRLHTLLTIELINFFHLKSNKNAQLIFASHDTNLLRKDIFRRDQIWFAEKDKFGATDLYSLVEYKVNQVTVRNDASFEKDYLAGKYGAIPFLGDLQKFSSDFLNVLHEQTN